MSYINNFCQLLNELGSSQSKSENVTSLLVEGEFSDAHDALQSISQHIKNESPSFEAFITLLIDGDNVNINEFDEFVETNPFAASYQLTVDTKRLAQSYFSGSGDVDEYLFTSIDALKSSFSALGLASPLSHSEINQSTNTRIHVYGLQQGFGGPKLSISPLIDAHEGPEWLDGSALPPTETFLKHVHFVTDERVNLEPRNFELSWGALEQPLARPFRLAYAQHLMVTLCTVYYSVDRLQFQGIKHIDASVAFEDDSDVDMDWLTALRDSVLWCYRTVDSDVPIQLFIDRLSLEYNEGNLLKVDSTSIIHCLSQAQNNYKYIVAKRSDEYRKELKDIYSDIRSVTDKFAEKAASLSSELLKSLMAIAFVFTIGTMSKAIVMGNLLHSRESYILFKIISIYLVFSFFIRWLNASSELKVAYKALISWSKKLNNHISTNEVKDLIEQQTKWSKYFYYTSLAVVTAIQGAIALAAFYIEGVLWYLNL